MARPITCDQDGSEPARMMLSDLDTGDTLAFCTEHWAQFCLSFVTSMLPDGQREQFAAAIATPLPEPAGDGQDDNDDDKDESYVQDPIPNVEPTPTKRDTSRKAQPRKRA